MIDSPRAIKAMINPQISPLRASSNNVSIMTQCPRDIFRALSLRGNGLHLTARAFCARATNKRRVGFPITTMEGSGG